MNSRRFIYCLLGVVIAGLTLYLLLTFLNPRIVEAKNNLDTQLVPIKQPDGQSLVISPDPPQIHEPTEIRVILFNNTGSQVIRYAQFLWSGFGIGQVQNPLGERIQFVIPPFAEGSTFVTWVPPDNGPYCLYVDIFDAPDAPNPIAVFQHNVNIFGHPDPNLPLFTQVVPVPIHNPLAGPATFVLTLTTPVSATHWEAFIAPHQIVVPIGGNIVANAVFTYTGGGQLPPGGMEVFRIDASANGQPAGGGDIVFGPPLQVHMRPEPAFAESEISVNPYPILPGEPAEICVEVRNITQNPRQAFVHFGVAPFGIALPFEPAAPPVDTMIPEHGIIRPCIHWVAPEGGQFAFEVQVETPGFPLMVVSQRVMDVSELLLPGTTSLQHFPVRNPLNELVTVTLALQPAPLNWVITVDPDVLLFMAPNETRIVTLTVTIPPDSIMPQDGSPVVDVQAFVGSMPVGGFRKIYRPPVPIHQPGDPIYAESEITINPYPPREREPTEICVDVRNPTEVTQTITVDFNVAEFGIGLPYHMIARPIQVTLPAHSIKRVCVTWVPPFGGRFGAEIGLQIPNHDRVFSQRVVDVGEILLPNQPSPFEFMVGNPYTFPISVTLGAIRYLPQWEVTFDPPALFLPPGARLPVVMTVVPVQRPGDPEPYEGEPVIDVEGYWNGNGENGLLGGFRKLFFPPIPIHQTGDPAFAEREINIFPYPPHTGEPTHLEFVVRNPTTTTQSITVTFEWSNLGIGLPFSPIDTRIITLPPGQAGLTWVTWIPPFGGEFCIRVKVDAPFFTEPFYSARNISIVRLPELYGNPEVFHFLIGDGGNSTRPLTITLGLKEYLPDWHVALASNQLVLGLSQLFAEGVMTITPPIDPGDLPIDGGPIADVSGFVNGYLVGGIRKVWRPPVPLGQLGEPSYAESEIAINPETPVAEQPATFSAHVRNNSAFTQTITLEFGWADFGFGIAFTTTNVVPTQTLITLSPFMTTTVSAQWTPPYTGHFCVQIFLKNQRTGEALHSQRNVDVIEVPKMHCESFVKEFLLENATPLEITVTLGSSAINLPIGWTYSITPTEVVLQPYESIKVTVVITPPCDLVAKGLTLPDGELDSNNPTKIEVEGYDQNGNLVGGVEMQFIASTKQPIYLPFMMRNSGAGTRLTYPPKSDFPEWLSYWSAVMLFIGGIVLYRRSFRL